MYIDHVKATKLLPDILEQNSIPAAYSKGLLEQYVPVQSAELDSSKLQDVNNGSSSEDEAAAVGMAASSKL